MLDTKRTPKHTMYLVGDAGNSKKPHIAPVLKSLKDSISKEPKQSSIIFLGDNIYPSGMPPSSKTKKYNEAAYRLRAQLGILDHFKGKTIFVAGNHDWKWGFDGLIRQQDIVKNSLTPAGSPYYEPLAGSPGPTIVNLGEVVVVTIDSHRLISQWNEQNEIGSTVGARFTIDFNNMIDSLKSKNIIIAMHHPPYTYGPHGGRFSFKQFLFPITEIIEKNSWIGYPFSWAILGAAPFLPYVKKVPTAIKIAMGAISLLEVLYIPTRQGLKSPNGDVDGRNYQQFKNALLTGVANKGKFTFVSGHEHTLQYLENRNHNFIVSGSGSKTNPVYMGNESLFSSASVGYSKLSFFEGGETWVTFYEVAKDGKSAVEIFQKKIKN